MGETSSEWSSRLASASGSERLRCAYRDIHCFKQYLRHRHREELESNWVCAVAFIEDVHHEQAGVIDSRMGGIILYKVTILVKYRSDGSEQERWITVDQSPTSLDGAKLQAFRWKGKQCTVRWRPSDPTKVIAEVS
jgi:hypothetical protein